MKHKKLITALHELAPRTAMLSRTALIILLVQDMHNKLRKLKVGLSDWLKYNPVNFTISSSPLVPSGT